MQENWPWKFGLSSRHQPPFCKPLNMKRLFLLLKKKSVLSLEKFTQKLTWHPILNSLVNTNVENMPCLIVRKKMGSLFTRDDSRVSRDLTLPFCVLGKKFSFGPKKTRVCPWYPCSPKFYFLEMKQARHCFWNEECLCLFAMSNCAILGIGYGWESVTSHGENCPEKKFWDTFSNG